MRIVSLPEADVTSERIHDLIAKKFWENESRTEITFYIKALQEVLDNLGPRDCRLRVFNYRDELDQLRERARTALVYCQQEEDLLLCARQMPGEQRYVLAEKSEPTPWGKLPPAGYTVQELAECWAFRIPDSDLWHKQSHDGTEDLLTKEAATLAAWDHLLWDTAYDTAEAAAAAYCEENELEPSDYSRPCERFHVVNANLAESLRQMGETVVDLDGEYVWGRTQCSTAPYEDWQIRQIVADRGLLPGGSMDWVARGIVTI